MNCIQVKVIVKNELIMNMSRKKEIDISRGSTVLQCIKKFFELEKNICIEKVLNELNNCTILLNGRVVPVCAQLEEDCEIVVLPLIGGG